MKIREKRMKSFWGMYPSSVKLPFFNWGKKRKKSLLSAAWGDRGGLRGGRLREGKKGL